MSKFNVCIIRPKGFAHSSAFAEVADSVSWSLSALGHEATVSQNWLQKDATNVIFGAELLAPNQPEGIKPTDVIFNLEQWTHPSMGKVVNLAQRFRCTVWDYSLSNVGKWREAGIYARHVPIGYTPNLTRIPKLDHQDIDVLFLGWMTPRREKIIADLREAGLKVVASSNCYGGARDNLVARAKVCLNVHHDGRENFEIVRVSYYLANGKCVVSEFSADDAEYVDLMYGIFLTSNVVGACVNICEFNLRASHEDDALGVIQKRDFTATIQKALTDLTPQEKVAARFAQAKTSGDMKDYVEWIRDHAKGTCMEIGVRDGASTSALLTGVENAGGVVCSVDISDCGALFAGHPQWKFIQTSSQNPKFLAPELDLLLVDGDHSARGYRADLDRYFPLVKPGGMILSHDIATPPELTSEATGDPERPSKFMRDEYFAFCDKHGLEHEELPGFSGLGVMHVPLQVESDESWEASAALTK